MHFGVRYQYAGDRYVCNSVCMCCLLLSRSKSLLRIKTWFRWGLHYSTSDARPRSHSNARASLSLCSSPRIKHRLRLHDNHTYTHWFMHVHAHPPSSGSRDRNSCATTSCSQARPLGNISLSVSQHSWCNTLSISSVYVHAAFFIFVRNLCTFAYMQTQKHNSALRGRVIQSLALTTVCFVCLKHKAGVTVMQPPIYPDHLIVHRLHSSKHTQYVYCEIHLLLQVSLV